MMPPTPAELRAEFARWKAVQIEYRFLSRTARVQSERRDYSIEAAFAAVIVQTLAYAVGDGPGPTVRVKV